VSGAVQISQNVRDMNVTVISDEIESRCRLMTGWLVVEEDVTF
jgi:hypothetical protein